MYIMYIIQHWHLLMQSIKLFFLLHKTFYRLWISANERARTDAWLACANCHAWPVALWPRIRPPVYIYYLVPDQVYSGNWDDLALMCGVSSFERVWPLLFFTYSMGQFKDPELALAKVSFSNHLIKYHKHFNTMHYNLIFINSKKLEGGG